ncbi:MAG TPA: hypothetical protein VGR35_15130 [Tepidisphaeraceae bacterium]|nr:hypothetical protein [Tepidisphaeraceae bacterium]
MSEYQYYEFIALDQPLTQSQLREVRAISSRAQLTPTSFVNQYHWGDFKGNPHKFLEKYYDAMLYYANWGTRRFMAKISGDALDMKLARLYCTDGESGVEMTSIRTGFVFDFVSNTDDPEGYDQMEQPLSPLIPVREALEAGDLRPLYIGWLASVAAGERDEDETEPPLPPGMNKLPAPLKALARFLRIDDDLLDAAAKGSERAEDQWQALKPWLAQIPPKRKDDLLLELMTGDPSSTAAQLRRAFNKYRKTLPRKTAKKGTRTVDQLLREAGMRN